MSTNCALYRGRFAPSPSGPLHFGSLIAALASYLDAKSNGGAWLLRMEDLDTPRCVSGAAHSILHTLEQHGLCWDESVLYQSDRISDYETVCEDLLSQSLAYHCQCTRKQILQTGGVYLGTCRNLGLSKDNASTRLRIDKPFDAFNDKIQGVVNIDDKHAHQDPIIKRRDGIFAYNLAVVVDDIFQGITHIVRGSDLVDTTVCQMALYKTLGQPIPTYAHIPVLSSVKGRKLSKQNHAVAIDSNRASDNVYKALRLLNLDPPAELGLEKVENQLQWAIQKWSINKIPKTTEMIVGSGESTYYSELR